jgi:nucleoside-diphosphate-sugar epimerase
MKHIVTGGAGFIGSNLVDCLVDDGHEVHIIDNFSTGKNISINDVAQLIGNNTIHREPVSESFANLADVSKAKKLLDWEPLTQLEDWIINYKSKIGLN